MVRWVVSSLAYGHTSIQGMRHLQGLFEVVEFGESGSRFLVILISGGSVMGLKF